MSQAGIVADQNLGALETITGNDAIAVSADAENNINLIGSGGATVTGDADTNTLTITVSAQEVTWNAISTSQTLVVNSGYICTGGTLSLALPAVATFGDVIELTIDGATSFSITQGAGQKIRVGNQVTSAGVTGSLTSTAQGDSLRMVCTVVNNNWNVLSSMGNPTIV